MKDLLLTTHWELMISKGFLTYKQEVDFHKALTLKNQILWKDDSGAITLIAWHSTYDIPFSANSVTNNPPPALWNASPYEDVSWSVTEQPWFPFSK